MNNKIIIVGSSGHARSIAIIAEMLQYEIVGFIDSYLPSGQPILKYKTLGSEQVLQHCFEQFGTNNVAMGIGEITNRFKLVERLQSINSALEFPVLISPMATVSNYTSIGAGTVIMSHSFVNVEASIGSFCVINSSSIIEHNTSVGNYCTISPGANIGGDVHIGEHTFVGSSATVIQRIEIGEHSVIGAGAVVTHSIPSGVLAVGVPAVVKQQNYSNHKIFK